jgi:uncharacterized protein (DUF58 family)
MIHINKKVLVTMCCTFVLAILNGGVIPYLMFYFTLTIVLFSLVYAKIIKSYLSIHIIIDNAYYMAGDETQYTIQANCHAFIPIPYIHLRFYPEYNGHIDDERFISITLEENSWTSKEFKFNKRGIYNFGQLEAEVQDLLGMIKFNYKCNKELIIKVYPKVYDIKMRQFYGKDIYLNKKDKISRNEDPFTPRDVREYRAGDSLKRVHWKVSAKHNALYVKNYDTISGIDTALFIDMNRKNYNYDTNGLVEENIVDISVSIIKHLIANKINLNIYLNNQDNHSEFIADENGVNIFIESIIKVKSDGATLINDFILDNIHKLSKVSQIIIVTSTVTSALKSCLLSLKNKGYNISVVTCLNSKGNLESVDDLKVWGIRYFKSDQIIDS